jgi:hypothetical protein
MLCSSNLGHFRRSSVLSSRILPPSFSLSSFRIQNFVDSTSPPVLSSFTVVDRPTYALSSKLPPSIADSHSRPEGPPYLLAAQLLPGSRTKHPAYQTPTYALPKSSTFPKEGILSQQGLLSTKKEDPPLESPAISHSPPSRFRTRISPLRTSILPGSSSIRSRNLGPSRVRRYRILVRNWETRRF